MLEPELISELNQFRRDAPGASACAAPSMNMHFSQMGVVTACCFNRTHVLGVYPKNSVDEIWRGAPAQELRSLMEQYDLTSGCEKCLQQLQARDFGGSHAVFYSIYARLSEGTRKDWGMPAEGDPEKAPLPLRLEFNIHNSCNLQCVMCHGLASSAIRTRREGMSAIENPYDDAFADQLSPYLPYVVETDFMGGEPFLIPVYFTLWERIASENPRLKTCILTNGTILNDQIRTMLESFNCWIHVSIDSIFKETYETIRRGASYEQVMENCDYYLHLMERRGLPFTFRFCPMRLNWHEIPDTVRYCNEKGISLMYNQVDSPLNLSLATLPREELKSVIDYLTRGIPAATATETGKENRRLYVELVERLEGFLNPANRIHGLVARLDTADAVVNQYSSGGKTKAVFRVAVPELEESRDALTQAAKRYLITRLNIEQALLASADVPAALSGRVDRHLRALQEAGRSTDTDNFVSTYLNELIRTYSGVWGVVGVHGEEVFENSVRVAAGLAEHGDTVRLVDSLLAAPVGAVYHAVCSLRSNEVVDLIDRGDWTGMVDVGVAQDAASMPVRPAAAKQEDVSVPEPAAAKAEPAVPASTRSETASPRVAQDTGSPPRLLRYGGRAGDRVAIRGEFTLKPEISGPPDLVAGLRDQNVLLAVRRLHITGTGHRVVLGPVEGANRVAICFESAQADGICGDGPFRYEFSDPGVPADLTDDQLKTLCWAFGMKDREFTLGSHGEYRLNKDDEDAQMEAMSIVANAPIRLSENPVSVGSRWETSWQGTRKHQDDGRLLTYRQNARLEEIDPGAGTARIASDTTATFDASNGGNSMALEAHSMILMDFESGLVLRAEASGTVTSTFPEAGFDIAWRLKARYGTV